jgi:pyridoxine kinase
MKRVITIQDISCVGKCSITTALPIISALGIETAILPTAVLSNHTQFSEFTCKDLEDQIEPISDTWERLGINFDGIYTGYLASEKQIDLVIKFFNRFGKDGILRFVDPAMADDGKLYVSFDDNFPKAMARLCGNADIIIPNLTEACLMTDTQYTEKYDEKNVRELLYKLAGLGTKKAVVITGVSFEPGKTGFAAYEIEKDKYTFYSHERLNKNYHGTGDVYSSVAFGELMNGLSLKEALVKAADFTISSIQETMENDPDKDYAVDFEKVLPTLWK